MENTANNEMAAMTKAMNNLANQIDNYNFQKSYSWNDNRIESKLDRIIGLLEEIAKK